ncbi:MAG TPA: HIT family protein [Patescibacteria group bacterium]|nr:HIT family protein [Patescibacteria group bacterium]
MDSDCVFCKIVSGEAPSFKIWEDNKHLAILSIFPNTPGFSVVMTKEHKPSYAFANDDDTLSQLIVATKKVARLLDESFDDVARTGMFFEGFGVDHLHSKLYPMHGTGDVKEWKPVESGSKMETFFEKYPGYLASNNSKRADDEDLLKIADKIKETAKKLSI